MAALTKLTTNINLEMSGDTKRYLVSAKQGDKATRFIVAKLLNNGEPYTIPTGSRAVINIAKPDGKHVYNTCTYSGSDVTVELTNQALAASGTAYCDIEIRTSDDSQIITSASFTMEIEKSQRMKMQSCHQMSSQNLRTESRGILRPLRTRMQQSRKQNRQG